MHKKILILDQDTNNIEKLEFLIKQYTSFDLDIVNSCKNISASYKENEYEFIIIEHSLEFSNELMNHICTINPQQKFILISNSINCPISCENCLPKLRFVRLLKPIKNYKEILAYLNNTNEFQCPNRYLFDSIDSLEKLIRFINLEGNRFFNQKEIVEDQLIISSNTDGNILYSEFRKINENINEKYFDINFLLQKIVVTQKNLV